MSMDYRDKTAYSINSKVMALVVAGILILVNILSLRYFIRFDVTDSKQYSISDSSISILQRLDDLVTVKAYFTDELPAQFEPVEQYLKDILGEYKAYSNGNLDFEFVDPALNADAAQEAQRAGVQQVQMQVLENDSYQVKQGYIGLAIFYEGKTEAMPFIKQEDLGNLEYDITSRILKMADPKDYVVGFLQGHGEHDLGNGLVGQGSDPKGYGYVNQVLSENYSIQRIDLSKGQTLDGVDVLVVAGPQRDLSDRDRFEIDQYLMAGGNSIFLVDAVNQQEGINVDLMETNVRTLFEKVGVSVESKLLMDQVNELTNFSAGPGQFYILPYPPFVRLVVENFSKNPIVQKVDGFTVRFASPLSVTEASDNLKYDRFVNTSQRAWVQDFPFQLNPNGIPSPTNEQLGSKPLAVYVTGLFPRLTDFDTVPVLQEWKPAADTQDFELLNVAQDPNRAGREILKEATAESKVIVMGDSDFISDQSVQQSQSGLVVFQNMVDFMTFGEELVNVRAKVIESQPLGEVSNTEKSFVKFAGVLLLPFLLCMYGVARIWIRRKEEKLLRLS